MATRAVLVTSLLALLAGAARADAIDATVTTQIAGRQDPRDGHVYTLVPIYQSLTLIGRIDTPYVQDLKIVASGWGEVAGGTTRDGNVGTGDLDLAYLEGGLFRRRVQIRIGRQMIFGGVARAMPLDGANIDVRIVRGLHLALYGGAAVTPRFGTHRGDAAGGARLSYRLGFDTEVGVSFLHVQDQGRVGRQEFGVDGRWRAHRTLTLTGFLALSTVEARVAEADIGATWQPKYWVEARIDWRRTAPDLWIPRSSIFSVFSQESHDEAGGNLWFRPVPRLTITGDYHAIVDNINAVGHRGGARLQVRMGAQFQTTAGAEVRVLELPDRGYVRTRVFGVHRFLPTLSLSIDADAMHLDRPINGQSFSFTGAATLAVELPSRRYGRWTLVVSAVEDVTPFVENRFEAMIKIAYNHQQRFREVTK